jgi:ubiquinone/menaquinone biosynthesis C-methylase UbiE
MPRDRRPPRPRDRRPAAPTSWDALARWYDGWVGEGGSEHHREVAIPVVMRLLAPQPGERVLDIGAGQGVLAPFVLRSGARFTGVDASPRLLDLARKRHGKDAQFLLGDARRLQSVSGLTAGSFDAVVFLLSLQDMDPLEPVFEGAAWALKPDGRAVILLTHPAFRIPRQSGWGWDEGRKLVYRRIDRYLTPLPVPMKPYPGQEGRTTRSFHRPLEMYVNTLSDSGFCIDRMIEAPGHRISTGAPSARAERLARAEIPLFLGLRAKKAG